MQPFALESSAEKAVMSYLSECFTEPKDDKTLLQVVANAFSVVMHAEALRIIALRIIGCFVASGKGEFRSQPRARIIPL